MLRQFRGVPCNRHILFRRGCSLPTDFGKRPLACFSERGGHCRQTQACACSLLHEDQPGCLNSPILPEGPVNTLYFYSLLYPLLGSGVEPSPIFGREMYGFLNSKEDAWT